MNLYVFISRVLLWEMWRLNLQRALNVFLKTCLCQYSAYIAIFSCS